MLTGSSVGTYTGVKRRFMKYVFMADQKLPSLLKQPKKGHSLTST